MVQNLVFGIRVNSFVLIPALPFSSCVTLGKFSSLSVFQFPNFLSRDSYSSVIEGRIHAQGVLHNTLAVKNCTHNHHH